MKEETELAREYAQLRLDMWGDDDWRMLSRDEQWLYMLLLSSPKTNRAGFSVWKPGGIANLAGGTSTADVLRIAGQLVEKHFIVVDFDTEELVIRSFIRHDGVLKQPNMMVTMATDWAGAYSQTLRGVVAHELNRLRDETPDASIWEHPRIQTMLAANRIDAKTLPMPETFGLGIGLGSTEGIGLGSHPLPVPSPSPERPIPPSSSTKAGTPTSGPRKVPYSKDFLEFWEMGLRKDDKISAWRAWEKQRKAGLLPDLETLKAAVKAYLEHNPDPTYRKYPATWLNAGGWENDYTPATTARAKDRLR